MYCNELDHFFGTVGAPYWKVGITLPWTIPIGVSWCTAADEVSLRAQHCGLESLIACEKSCQSRHGDTERQYQILILPSGLNSHWLLLWCSWLYV